MKNLKKLSKRELKTINGKGGFDPIPGYQSCMLTADDNGNIVNDNICPPRTCCNANNECVPLRLNQC